MLDEHFRIMGPINFYEGIEEMLTNLNAHLATHNTKLPHHVRRMNG